MTCKGPQVRPASALRFKTRSSGFGISEQREMRPSATASRVPLLVVSSAGMRKQEYPSCPPTKTETNGSGVFSSSPFTARVKTTQKATTSLDFRCSDLESPLGCWEEEAQSRPQA